MTNNLILKTRGKYIYFEWFEFITVRVFLRFNCSYKFLKIYVFNNIQAFLNLEFFLEYYKKFEKKLNLFLKSRKLLLAPLKRKS